MKRFQKRWLTHLLVTILVVAFSATSQAADFNLAWDPPDGTTPSLIGYNIYYKAEASILDDPEDSVMIYVPLTEAGFDPDNPSYLVSDLLDDTTYFFTVSAVYEVDESSMSNEIEGINGASIPSSLTGGGSGGSSGGGGCFIGSLLP